MEELAFEKMYRRTIKKFMRTLVNVPRCRNEPFVEITLRNKIGVQIYFSKGYQSRQEASTHMFLEALKTIKYEARKNRKFTLYTSDCPPADPTHPVLSYSAIKGSKNIIAVPDFIFWNWPEVGITDYSELVVQIMNAGAQTPKDERLF